MDLIDEVDRLETVVPEGWRAVSMIVSMAMNNDVQPNTHRWNGVAESLDALLVHGGLTGDTLLMQAWRRSKMLEDTQRLRIVVTNALDAFWEVVERDYRLPSGDLSPDDADTLSATAKTVVYRWLKGNV